MIFRKAIEQDILKIVEIYDAIHEEEEKGNLTIGWKRMIYPTSATVQAAIERDDMFVCEEDGHIIASAIINQIQVDSYADAAWEFDAADAEVMVLHTLVVSPSAGGKGIGTAFVRFYEAYADKNQAYFLRMDTNEKNAIARKLYRKLGYKEVDMIPCEFNGIEGVHLILLEKKLYH